MDMVEKLLRAKYYLKKHASNEWNVVNFRILYRNAICAQSIDRDTI